MLDQLFNPDSIVVVGATPKEGKVGNTVLKNIITSMNKSKADVRIYVCGKSKV